MGYSNRVEMMGTDLKNGRCLFTKNIRSTNRGIPKKILLERENLSHIDFMSQENKSEGAMMALEGKNILIFDTNSEVPLKTIGLLSPPDYLKKNGKWVCVGLGGRYFRRQFDLI